MITIKRKSVWIVTMCLIFCSACGYGFTGGREMPAGVKRVFIKIFKNNTTEVGVENYVTNDLINEFTQHHKGLLSNDIRKTDAILTGIINSIKFKTISRRGKYEARERRVTIIVSVKLTDLDGMVLWRTDAVSASGEYDVTPDKMLTEQNRKDALASASDRLSEEIYSRMTEDF